MSEQLIQTPGVFGDNGNFLLERELGQGGMGGVYMGRDKMLDRPVAVKVMLKQYGDDQEFVEKFKKEAQAAARLIHPNIAQIYSYGISDGMPYIAMELVAGGSLDSLMKNTPGATDIPRIMKIGEQIAQALRCAADQGLVHGDVKPENVLLDANGNAKLVDFGLAAMQKDTDEIWGTPYYISPEKVKKEPVDYRADMYSLGGTLYHALTGVAPFEGDDANAVVRKRFEENPKPPSELRPAISPAIDELVLKLLAFNKEDRYPSFEALVEAFKNVLANGLTTGVRPVATVAKPKTTMRRGTRTAMRTRITKTPTVSGEVPEIPPVEAAPEAEEETGNIGTKVIAAVFGVIALIAAIVGGLVWYQVHDKKSRAAEKQASIVREIGRARTAISDTRRVAAKFADDFAEFSKKATVECQNATDGIIKAIPEIAGIIKPPLTKELLDAIALTNSAAQAEQAADAAPAASNAAPAETKPVANQPAASQAAAKPAAPVKLPQFRKPTEDEADPNSPEGQDYLKAKKAFEAEQLKLLKEGKLDQKSKEEEKKAEPEQAPAETPKETPLAESEEAKRAIDDMRELWARAYSCQASAIKMCYGAKKVLEECDKADRIQGETEESMNALAKLSGDVLEMYNDLKGSKDVENVQKGITFIKSHGEKLVRLTVNDLFRKKREAERKAKKEKEESDKKAKAEQEKKEREELVVAETEKAKERFNELADSRTIKQQLDWGVALKQLKLLKDEMKTAEGGLAVDLEMKKVTAMKSAHDIFIKNITDYQFKNNKHGLKGCPILKADETEFTWENARKKTGKITWSKFYQQYHGELNELINHYIVDGRKNGSKLELGAWSEAMSGTALTLRIICSENPSAAKRGEELAYTVAKQHETYIPFLTKMFPDIDFTKIPEDE